MVAVIVVIDVNSAAGVVFLRQETRAHLRRDAEIEPGAFQVRLFDAHLKISNRCHRTYIYIYIYSIVTVYVDSDERDLCVYGR